MAQSDMTIQNQSFPSFRSDLNDALSAINSMQSGTSRPSSAVAGTMWLDTTNATSPTLKLYDGSDDISLATLDYTANTVNWLDSTVSADLVNDTTPQLGGMLDVNGNSIGNGTEELIKFSETASAVNEITVTNSATGNAPELSSTGDDTNIDLKLTPKGSGKLVLDGIKFPNADGTTGQALQTDGSGNLSFATISGGDNTPSFRVTMSTNPSFANETWTKAPFNTVDWDTDSAFDNTTNYRFTVPSGEDGKYCFICKGGIDNLDVGEFIATAYYINGSVDNHSYNTVWVAKSANGYGYVNNVYVVDLSAGDYVEVYFQHNEGASQNLNSSYTFFSGFKLSGV